MSSALALAAVTSVLVDLLENRLIQREVTASVGAVQVSAPPLDKMAVGADERAGLNLPRMPHHGHRPTGGAARWSTAPTPSRTWLLPCRILSLRYVRAS